MIAQTIHTVRAGEIGTFRGGSGFPRRFQGRKSGNIPFYKVSDMNLPGNEVVMGLANNYVNEKDLPMIGANVIPPGSIIFAKVGAAVFLERKRILSVPACIDNNMAAFIPDNALVLSRYAYHAFSNIMFGTLVATTALPSINNQQLSSIPVTLPGSLAKQQRIAKALDDTDALIAGLERKIAKKEAVKQGMMQQLLTGRTRLPGFTEPWQTHRLGDLARIQTGSRDNQDKTSGGRYPFFVRSENVERIDSYSYDCEAILVPGEGRIGSIFHYVNGRFEVHQRVYKIESFESCAMGQFIYFFMQQHFGRHAMENSVKATVDSLRLPTFQNFVVKLPSVVEQRSITGALIDASRMLELLKDRLREAHLVKEGMMQQLLTGRIRLPVEDAA